MSENMKILILPPSEYGLACADVIEEIPGFQVAGFLECLDQQRVQEEFAGYPIHWIGDLARLRDSHGVVCAMGSTSRDQFVRKVESLGLRLPALCHPTSRVSARATIADGTFIDVNAVVAGYSTVARHARISRGAIIGHHTHIGEYASVQPGANIAGHCHVGDQAYIGMSAVIRDHVKIGCRSTVGAGAVVTKDVPNDVTVVGVPARIVDLSE
ncbi:MAG TPA: hypothetical protein DCY79_21350 [Planctomycetaceae bacterium]|nr:hypothetical protein [Planctomycetaceae bacterium]